MRKASTASAIVILAFSARLLNAFVPDLFLVSNGLPDATFGTGGFVTTAIGPGNDIAQAVAIQPDGKIVAAGYAFSGTNNDFAVVR